MTTTILESTTDEWASEDANEAKVFGVRLAQIWNYREGSLPVFFEWCKSQERQAHRNKVVFKFDIHGIVKFNVVVQGNNRDSPDVFIQDFSYIHPTDGEYKVPQLHKCKMAPNHYYSSSGNAHSFVYGVAAPSLYRDIKPNRNKPLPKKSRLASDTQPRFNTSNFETINPAKTVEEFHEMVIEFLLDYTDLNDI